MLAIFPEMRSALLKASPRQGRLSAVADDIRQTRFGGLAVFLQQVGHRSTW